MSDDLIHAEDEYEQLLDKAQAIMRDALAKSNGDLQTAVASLMENHILKAEELALMYDNNWNDAFRVAAMWKARRDGKE